MNKGFLAKTTQWMAQNTIAANMLMVFFVLGGYYALQIIEQEAMPSFTLDTIEVSVEYPGASPKEVEESILLPIETELRSISSIRQVNATATENNGHVMVELAEGSNTSVALQDIKIAIDRISTFPNNTERPEVRLSEDAEDIVALALYGDKSEQDLYATARIIRDELLAFPDIAKVDIKGTRRPEVIIEVPSSELRARSMALSDVADAVALAGQDLPAGSIHGENGETLVRTMGRRNNATEFGAIEVLTENTEDHIPLASIATVKDGFDSSDKLLMFNGKRGYELVVYQSDQARVLDLSERIYAYIEDRQTTLPAGVSLDVLDSQADSFQERIGLLYENGFLGLILVVIALALFMEARLAFWVSASIPVVFLGALTFMPAIAVPLNMITLFAFIITLGIVVDDAVIVGENIYRHIQLGTPVRESVLKGVTEMLTPVLFAVGTNILAFLPSMFLPGEIGQMLKPMAMFIFAIFTVSLLEALFILPAHLMGMENKKHAAQSETKNALARTRKKVADTFEYIKMGPYSRLLKFAMRNPLNLFLIFFGIATFLFSWVATGRIDIAFAPKIESTRIDVEFEMPAGSPFPHLIEQLDHIDDAATRALQSLGGQEYAKRHMKEAEGNQGSVTIILVPQADRPFSAGDFVSAWRKEVGLVAGPMNIFFDFEVGPGGNKELEVELSHTNTNELEKVAQDLASRLSLLQGVQDIDNGLAQGKPQLSLRTTPLAQKLGLNTTEIGKQLRDTYYGNEAIRQIRAGDEIRIRVRRPAEERSSFYGLENLIIKAPDGTEVPLIEAASIEYGHAYSEIKRRNNRRIITVAANVDRSTSNVSLIRKEVEERIMPELMQSYSGLSWSHSGEAEMEDEANSQMLGGTLMCFGAIFAALAALFRSYMDAVIVMLVIPFCIAFAIFGHILMGFPINVLSTFGFISLSGLVINGSLVLTMRAKENIASGMPAYDAIYQASLERFRPIMLTSLTTTIGLVPMLFEVSTQALFMIPLAIALSFGSFFSIWTILLLTPALLLAWHHTKARIQPFINRKSSETNPASLKEV